MGRRAAVPPRGNDENSYPMPQTPEARQQQMIFLAEQCAERQLRDGTASAAVITHYLRMATEREKLEQQKLEYETKLAQSKIDAIAQMADTAKKYEEAIAAMKRYSGNDDEEVIDNV